MKERLKLVADYCRGEEGVTSLARRYGVSRKTVYKWIFRHMERGREGMLDLSRAPHRQARAISRSMEDSILAMKARWPDWGAPKLRHKLLQEIGAEGCPSESTLSAVLKRHGLVKRRRVRHRAVSGGTSPLSHCHGPNEVWCVDFKGWWRTLDGRRCDPLTVTDAYSRYLLRCVGLNGGTGHDQVRVHFELLFREHGLPQAIRTDNGSPFASTGLGGLTELSVWWVQLGIRLERITPGCPQENGRHERMHLSLQQSEARVARANGGRQQKAFDQYLKDYNEERPHEALGFKVPADFYTSSSRIYDGHLPSWTYPDNWVLRRVMGSGQMKWGGREVRVTGALIGHTIGLEPLGPGQWKVWFQSLPLGTFNEAKHRILRFEKLPAQNEEKRAA